VRAAGASCAAGVSASPRTVLRDALDLVHGRHGLGRRQQLLEPTRRQRRRLHYHARAHVLTEKLDTPIARTLPLASAFSMSAHVWLNVHASLMAGWPSPASFPLLCSACGRQRAADARDGEEQTVALHRLWEVHEVEVEVVEPGAREALVQRREDHVRVMWPERRRI
jgi:hypothetical protein